MEKEKNNTGLIVLVIVLFLLVIGLGGYVVYDKVLSNEETPEEETTNDVIEEKLPEWAEYLLNQNITKIVVQKNNDVDPINACPEPVEITKDQLKQILEKMTAGTLIRHVNTYNSFTGPCGTYVMIEYGDNNQLKLPYYEYMQTTDSSLLNLLSKEEYTAGTVKPSDGSPNDLYQYQYEWDASYVDTLLG